MRVLKGRLASSIISIAGAAVAASLFVSPAVVAAQSINAGSDSSYTAVTSLSPSTPTTDVSSLIAALEAQVQQLEQQIAQLQAGSSNSTGPSTGSCSGTSLTIGSTGSAVLALQQFLVSRGLLTPESESSYFGPLTQASVQQWQTANATAANGLPSSGSPSTTGWGIFGLKSIAASGLSLCTNNGGTGNTNGPAATTQGGFTAVPTSGTAPLSVTFSRAPFVITSQSSTSALADAAHQNTFYGIDFGDGTATQGFQLSCSPNNQQGQTCTPSVMYTYQSPGTYTATLEQVTQSNISGGSTCDTNCQTIVGIANTPVTTPITSLTITVAASPTQATTFSASPTSGSAPLTVSFSGSFNGTSYSVDYGDGKSSGQLSACGWLSDGGGQVCGQVGTLHVYASPGTYTAHLMNGNAILASATVAVTGGTSFSASPLSGAAPLVVSFSASGGSTIDYGYAGGSISCLSPGCSDSVFTYTSPGTYTAALKDSSGAVIRSVTITVN
jgi:PKD repeat protein